MAEEEEDDKWLYGESGDSVLPETNVEEPNINDAPVEEPEDSQDNAKPENGEDESLPQENPPETNDESEKADNNEEDKGSEGSDKEDYDEDSDDDVNVVIGDIKTSPAYTSLNIKRGGLLTSTAKGEKGQSATQPGKFTVEEFEQAGSINGVPVSDFNLDVLEDKPWRKPGADITDYFNYGFNEETWKAYCERQKRMRVSESGTGLLPLNSIGMPRGPVPIMNDNSKYSGNYAGVRKAGPPPGRRMTGSIDVIGGTTARINTPVGKAEAPKENVIQVMTADRREYSRKPGFPDLSMPPPTANSFETFQPEYGFNPEPEPFYGGYEPTQDSQWGVEPNPNWQPQGMRYLTPTPAMMPNIASIVPPPVAIPPPVPAPTISPSDNGHESRPRSRERESSRREIDKRSDRERSHRRDRSSSRSRRRKSRSRSPGHRSHRKKKSRRHDDTD